MTQNFMHANLKLIIYPQRQKGARENKAYVRTVATSNKARLKHL